jgi:hypothetical protein
VHLWFASVLPLLLAVEAISFVEQEKRWYTELANTGDLYEEGITEIVMVEVLDFLIGLPSSAVIYLTKYYMDGPTLVAEVQFYEDGPAQLVLGVSMAVFLFCLHGLRVLWPKGFIKGELSQHDIDGRNNGLMMLIAWQANGSMVFSSLSGCGYTCYFW